jgi:peptide chain release factor subunit 1
MIKENDLQELLDFQPQQPVLSIFLSTDPSEGSADAYKLRLRTMLKEVAMPQDISAVEEYMNHQFDWSGRSVAIFSCAAKNFFRAYSMAIPIPNRVHVDNRPHVKPLVDLFDYYGGYGVALVDKQGTRLFYFHLGELLEQEGMMGESIKRTKRGGASSYPGRRGGTAGQTNHVEELTERNMKEAAGFAEHFFQEHNIRRVLIGGTEDNVAQFRSLLSKSWQSLIVGTFPSSMTASTNEVMERTFQIGKEAETQREAHLIDVVITNTAKKHGGVTHLEETLRALHEGKVQTLVLQEGLREMGFQCQGCGFLTSIEMPTCPFCGGSFQPIADVVDLAVQEVMGQGGVVEFIHMDSVPKKFGGIGAILRYG